MKPAVCLLSGGLDSATCLAYARREGFACYALSFNYGQRHLFELVAAKKVATSLGAIGHKIIDLNLRAFGGSALTADIEVPKSRSGEQMAVCDEITTNVVLLLASHHDVTRAQGEIEDKARALGAIELHQISRAFAPTRDDLPAISTRRAPADASGLQQYDRKPAFCRVQRRM